jgi:hypothetical protein
MGESETFAGDGLVSRIVALPGYEREARSRLAPALKSSCGEMRSGNVGISDGWEEVPLPEVKRQRNGRRGS